MLECRGSQKKITKIIEEISKYDDESIKEFKTNNNLSETILNKLSPDNIINVKNFVNRYKLIRNLKKINPSLLKLDLFKKYDNYILYRYRKYDEKIVKIDKGIPVVKFKVFLFEMHQKITDKNKESTRIILTDDGKLITINPEEVELKEVELKNLKKLRKEKRC